MKIIFYLRVWFALLALVVIAGTVAAEPLGIIRFAPEKDYGPFIFEDSGGRITGLSMDILTIISQKQNLQLKILPAQTLATILEQARLGEVDLISSLRPTPERLEYLRFSRPYVSIPAVLIGRADRSAAGNSQSYLTLAALSHQPVAVGRGYGVESFVRKKFPAVKWRAVADDLLALQTLQAGVVQAAVMDLASFNFLRKNFPDQSFQIQGRVGFEYPLSFAYPKDKPEIGEVIELGLRQLPLTQRDALVQRWVGSETQDYVGEDRGRLLWIATAVIALAAVLAMFALLKKKGVP